MDNAVYACCLSVERVSTLQLVVLLRHVRCSALTRKNVSTARSVTPVSCYFRGCYFLFLLFITGTVLTLEH